MADPSLPHELNRQWADAFNAGDLRGLLNTYEPNAVMVPAPGAAPLQGHDAIEQALTGFLALGGQLEFTPRHWVPSGDLAFASITFTMRGGRDADGPVELHGTTAEVLRRQSDGTWKYLIDAPFAGNAE